MFVDTSGFYAFLSVDDRDHEAVVAVLREAIDGGEPLNATSYVVSETMGLVQKRLGLRVLRRFVADVLPLVRVRWIGAAEHDAAWSLHQQVRKRAFTIVDASSAATMRREGEKRICALDGEFARLGLEPLPG